MIFNKEADPCACVKLRTMSIRLGAIDWDRRLFDALIPLPDGTTCNA